MTPHAAHEPIRTENRGQWGRTAARYDSEEVEGLLREK